ncbi:hypothetical protein [Rhizobium sp. 18065]|uniref:hypothetical protein n=1 Tax=Rhizobium sp. 18065 TaxID=2681411 RepID=UPI0024532721|nr:hypothetical protein [Rhizobium sp. 18065]
MDEVDVVIEDRRGRIIGIEVKASATVKADDFRGLRQFLDPIKHRHSQFIWAILHDPVANIGLKRWTALLIAAPYNHAMALHASEGHHGDAKYSTSRSFPYAGCKDRPRREP